MNKTKNKILVLGAGSWGTALALQLSYAGHDVFINSWKKEHNLQMQKANNNIKYVPDVETFPVNLRAISDYTDTIDSFKYILIATPSSGFKNTLLDLKKIINKNHILISATKGFSRDNNQLLSDLSQEILPDNSFSIITGPSFSKEVAKKMPTAVVAAANDINVAQDIQALFSTASFRCYASADIIGAQVGGAVKNVLAIAAGISDGAGFGANAHAALITRGLREIKRLGMDLGAKEDTFMGLSCLGDLILTCSDNQSRNRRFGMYIAQGMSIEQASEKIGNVVEGYTTTKAVHKIAKRLDIDMPIVNAVYNVLYKNADIKNTTKELMLRSLKPE